MNPTQTATRYERDFLNPPIDWQGKLKALNKERMSKNLSPFSDVKAMLEDLVREYGAQWKIGVILGIGSSTVLKKMRELGIPPSRKLVRLNNGQITFVRSMWKRGYRKCEIIKISKLSRVTVDKILRGVRKEE